MSQGKLKIHSENILPIIKRWLYSDREIFVRELVSNATDALVKCKKVITEGHEGRIDIQCDKEGKKLLFSDNGIGMDAEEVEKYIAQIAFSGAEEFLKKYETKKEDEQIIGHFGLGFYSAYMVAKNVEIQTLSFKENAEPVYWQCDGGSDYIIEKGDRKERGTTVILTLSDEDIEYLEPTKIRTILHQYCRFLPFPIYLNGSLVNDKAPLWIKNPSECTEKEYLDFYATLFPMDQTPHFWIHLNVDYPFSLKGILYFPKIARDAEMRNEKTVQLYCNRVFVSDQCKDLFPEYLMLMRGALDSPDIPLNVSRSSLQMDRTVRQLSSHISKKVADRLSSLYRSEREKFLSLWSDLELIIKFGILHDEKFYERAKEFLVWKNSKNEWVTLEEHLEITQAETVYYAQEAGYFLDFYREKGIDFLCVRDSMLDQAVIQLLEKRTKAKFKRIDAHLDEKLLDPSKERGLLDADGRSESSKIAAFFKRHLQIDDLEVEAKSLSTPSLPACLLLKEEERRMRDSLAAYGHSIGGKLVKPTLVINTNNKLIQAIQSVEKLDASLASEMIKGVYDLTRLSQKEMEPEEFSQFISRSNSLLEKLSLKLTMEKAE